MKEETKKWLEKAKDDLKKAKDNFEIKNYDITAFLCQQSAEKSLKSLLIEKTSSFPKMHDLVILGRKVKMSKELIDEAKELTFAYAYTRYPDVQEEPNLKEKSSKFLETSKQILKWVEKKISAKN